MYCSQGVGITTIQDTTIDAAVYHNGSTIILDGKCSINLICGINSNSTGKILIKNGATITWEPLTGSYSKMLFTNNVGDLEVESGGTATIKYNGGTKKVTGSGSYFNVDGTTDLTEV